MEVTYLLDIHTRTELYQWYLENHQKVSDFWLRVNRAAEDCPGVVRYVDAVEVALCFGWIDSTQKKIDDGKPIQHFTPAKRSAVNRQVPTSLDEAIAPNIVCSQDLRAFFEQYLGPSFRFKVEFQSWLRENAGLTFRDAVEAYPNLCYLCKNDAFDSKAQGSGGDLSLGDFTDFLAHQGSADRGF